MKLLINAKPLVPPLTGIGHYTAQLSRYLLESGELNDAWATRNGRGYSRIELQAMLCALDQRTEQQEKRAGWKHRLVTRIKNVIALMPFSRQLYTTMVHQWVRLSPWMRFDDNCLYWEPGSFCLPLQYRCILTVYDLSHIVYPQHHPADRVALLNARLEPGLRSAAHIVAISEFTKSELIRFFSLPASSISVVEPGVADEYYVVPEVVRLSAVRREYSLPDRFVLFVGTVEPRKNIAGLLTAFINLPPDLRKRFPLVLVGARGWLSEALERDLVPLIRAGEVIRLGYVTQEDLPVIYRLADLFAYTSFYEGYGMPVAEAMASGTAVLTSDCSSMPEVARGAARLVNPADTAAITAQLQELLTDQPLRDSMAQAGQVIAEQYRWHCSGRKMLDVLKSVASVQVNDSQAEV